MATGLVVSVLKVNEREVHKPVGEVSKTPTVTVARAEREANGVDVGKVADLSSTALVKDLRAKVVALNGAARVVLPILSGYSTVSTKTKTDN